MAKNLYTQLKALHDNDEKKFRAYLIREVLPILKYRDVYELEKALVNSDRNIINATRQKNYYQFVTFFHFVMGVGLKTFQLPENDPLYKKIKPIQRHYVELHQLKEFEGRRTRRAEISSEYYEASKTFLKHIKTNLYVYDYLDRFSHEKNKKKYQYVETHNDIFEQIEVHLQNEKNNEIPKIKYARFLSVKLGFFQYKNRQFEPKLNVVKAVVDMCSVPLFKHICRCLKQYPSFEFKESKQNNILNYYGGFYLIAYPLRANHYAYLNEGQFCLTEYYRYDRSSRCKPDLLFIEDNNGDPDNITVSEIYEDEIEKLFYPSMKLRLFEISQVINQYKKELRVSNKKELLIEAQKKRSDPKKELQESQEKILDNQIEELQEAINKEHVAQEKIKFYEEIFVR